MKVVFFHRKRRTANFSIERLFNQVRQALPHHVNPEVRELSYYSEGFFKRLYISVEAALHQGDVNHITGDVNFIAIFLRKKRTVLTIHDVGLMEHPNPLARLILRWFWLVIPARRSAVITTVSEATKQEFLKYVSLRSTRIQVVHNPVSSLFKPEPKIFQKTEPRILQVGTKSNKNIKRLVKALHGISCILDIVGVIDSTLEQDLRENGINYVLSKNLSDTELLDKYRSADILSFVSTYEGFGMPIIEANAIGRAVITSNILSMPEVGRDAAHYADPFDVKSIREGILLLIEDDAYREQLISNGFENAKRFDAVEIAKQYAAIYDSLNPLP